MGQEVLLYHSLARGLMEAERLVEAESLMEVEGLMETENPRALEAAGRSWMDCEQDIPQSPGPARNLTAAEHLPPVRSLGKARQKHSED